LYYRLNVHVLRVPPLRERRSDVPGLADHFLAMLCRRFGMKKKRLDPAALETLSAYDWRRNNVRELRNIIERLIIAAPDEMILADHVPPEIRDAAEAHVPAASTSHTEPRTFQEQRADAERRIVLEALHRNDWHISRTARDLGLADHASLLKIMRRHRIARSRGARTSPSHVTDERR
ncbi:MAG: helix-turn-helix domain-containing protein, partial [Longimicrobiales bacterium]